MATIDVDEETKNLLNELKGIVKTSYEKKGISVNSVTYNQVIDYLISVRRRN